MLRRGIIVELWMNRCMKVFHASVWGEKKYMCLSPVGLFGSCVSDNLPSAGDTSTVVTRNKRSKALLAAGQSVDEKNKQKPCMARLSSESVMTGVVVDFVACCSLGVLHDACVCVCAIAHEEVGWLEAT
jgi:hypothetical protein